MATTNTQPATPDNGVGSGASLADSVAYLRDMAAKDDALCEALRAQGRSEESWALVRARADRLTQCANEIMAWRRVCMQTQGLLHMLKPLLDEQPEPQHFRWKELRAKPEKVWAAIKEARAIDGHALSSANADDEPRRT